MFSCSTVDTQGSSSIECYKMQGSGNDFVLLDNRSLRLPKDRMPAWAKSICRRAFGIGADGLIFLDAPKPGQNMDYVWHFFNADGSRAEMCGNGSRCAAKLAWNLGMAPRQHVLGTDAGPIRAHVLPEDDLVKVQLTPHHDVQLKLGLEFQNTIWDTHFVNTGVPHLVVFVPDVASINVQELGRQFRFHPRFAPAGTNVNFVQVLDNTRFLLRTYERGVEGETLACGTGAAAAALIAWMLGRSGKNVILHTSGQEELGITIEDGRIFLTGKAVLVFIARLFPQSLGLEH
jgi:diaminopimelate epimerase